MSNADNKLDDEDQYTSQIGKKHSLLQRVIEEEETGSTAQLRTMQKAGEESKLSAQHTIKSTKLNHYARISIDSQQQQTKMESERISILKKGSTISTDE